MNTDNESATEGSRIEPLLTIDELADLAQNLLVGLKRLAEYKHPLFIRKGRKGVRFTMGNEESQTVKAGSKTYFFDIKRTKDNKPYLVITESRFKGEGGDRERSTIAIFQEHISEFLGALQRIADKLG